MDLPGSTARKRLTQMHHVQENLLRASRQQLSKEERAFQRSISRECTDLRRKWQLHNSDYSPGAPDSPIPNDRSGANSPPLRRTKSVFQFPEPQAQVDATSSPSDSEMSLDNVGRQQRSRPLLFRSATDDPDLNGSPPKVGSLECDTELPPSGSVEWQPGTLEIEEDEEEAWKREIRRRRRERDLGRRQAADHVAALLGGCQLRAPQRAPIPVTRVKSLPSYMLSTASTRSKMSNEARKGPTDSP